MLFPTSSSVAIATLITAASALPGSNIVERGTAAIQAYTSWQLRLFSEAQPVCNPEVSNVNISIWTRSGRYGRECTAFDPTTDTEDSVTPKSLSFKTVEEDAKDFCMFSSTDCAPESFIDSITNGWEVCYPYAGWVGWSVVEAGTSCV
ncbi:hypothetical protein N7532_001581 [Penicillium argentinense]|uniref:Uncharacterized protein n=1 Tax=Penicillium argentinense TaxID=1131581 RepID=A0A9W9KMK5_9EURO|nr:uncharacterized protein N7532_001581 [Penicillium argentinense]KAJ5111046.1 hypothetical protein N7532_001581 [Penicillium argentinense]